MANTAIGCRMWACLALCVAAALFSPARAQCTACIDEHCYRKHLLSGARERSVGINRNTHTSYYVDGNRIMIKCDLDNLICNDTDNRWDIGRINVDESTGDVYGLVNAISSRSLYKMDLVNNTKELLVQGHLFDLAFKDKLIYYSIWLGRGLYIFKNGESKLIPGTDKYNVYNFIVDRVGDVYFFTYFRHSARHVVRRLSKGVVGETIYCDSSYLMTLDADNNAVFINPETHAIYRVTDGQLVEVGAINDPIDDIGTPWFDKDNNMVYRNKSKDYLYLKRVKDVQCSISMIENTRIVTETLVTTEQV